MKDTEKFLKILKRNIQPAFGCTDPVTPALAAATAYQCIQGELHKIDVTVSNDIYKGAFGVIIPGTNITGIPFAVVLGAVGGNPNDGLMVLSHCNKEDIEKAKCLLDEIEIHVHPDSSKGEIYTEITISTSNGTSKAIIDGRHDEITFLEVNGSILKDNRSDNRPSYSEDLTAIRECTLNEILEFVNTVPIEKLSFLKEGISMNGTAGRIGLMNQYGLGIGKSINECFVQNRKNQCPYFEIKAFSSAAGDFRMGGGNLPIMAIFGSGNQGAVIFNALSKIKEEFQMNEERLIRGICLSSLIAGYINLLLEEGTPFCDCAIVASTATAAGIVYMINDSIEKINDAIQLTISALSGIICDGAKPNCAQKISLGVGAAIENAFFSLDNNMKIPSDGILGDTFQQTFKNLTVLGAKIREPIEETIVEILHKK